MTTNRQFWHRSGYISIEDDSQEEISFGREYGGIALDFKFDGTKWGDCHGLFNCGILGLNREHINMFTVWDKGTAVNRRRKIKVYAGYKHDSMATPIFSGFILEALPTNPPERWLNITAMRDFDVSDIVTGVPPSEGDMTLYEVAEKIAELNGLSFNKYLWLASLDGENKCRFTFNNNKKSDLPRIFADTFNVSAYAEDGRLVIDDRRGWMGSNNATRILSTENGLISLGNVTMYGADVVMRLDDSIKLHEWIKLDSKMIPSSNPKPYYVVSKRHIGHYRGDEWFTRLQMIRMGANI